MGIDQLHREFLSNLDLAVEHLAAREQADALAAGVSSGEVSAKGVGGAFDVALLIKYLPVVLDALSVLIKKLQTA